MTTLEKLKSFILKHKTEKGKPYTNTSIGNPKLSLYIDNNDYDDFINLYSVAVTNGAILHLTEKPIEPSPLKLCDIINKDLYG